MTVQEYKKKADSKKYSVPYSTHVDDLEKKFWTIKRTMQPIYGADVGASLMDKTNNVRVLFLFDKVRSIFCLTLKCSVKKLFRKKENTD